MELALKVIATIKMNLEIKKRKEGRKKYSTISSQSHYFEALKSLQSQDLICIAGYCYKISDANWFVTSIYQRGIAT